MRPASPFTAVDAVESWDAWFRWRDARGLHDRTIEATWWRVARTVAAAEGAQAEAWARRYFDAFSQWRLLPDERLLRAAGTREQLDGGALSATLNVAAFVASPLPRLDIDRLADTAALAVRLLNGARRLSRPAAAPLTIGLVGLGDALRLLGLPYGSDAACKVAAGVAAALSRGVRLGSEELDGSAGEPITTAILPQPRLARLANGVSDALDPARPADASAMEEQLRTRVAMQPWIDAPIDYPLVVSSPPSAHELQALAEYARGPSLPSVRVDPPGERT